MFGSQEESVILSVSAASCKPVTVSFIMQIIKSFHVLSLPKRKQNRRDRRAVHTFQNASPCAQASRLRTQTLETRSLGSSSSGLEIFDSSLINPHGAGVR